MTQPTHDSHTPFQRDALVDKPGIHGARWWHQALADRGTQMARRDAVRNILIATAVIAGFGTLLGFCVKSMSEPDAKEQRLSSLEMQRDFGWNFGAVGEPLVYDGRYRLAFNPAQLLSLAAAVTPSERYRPFHLSTLFEAPDATPRKIATLPPEEIQGFQPLFTVLQPIVTPEMEAAYLRGVALGDLLKGQETKIAVVIDLPGPSAVAFAAGLAAVSEPVFLLDNWPHPRGVVRSHLALAAATYYQPRFREASALRGASVAPAFVLDRDRLTPYVDDARQFDNRYVAKLPPWNVLKAHGLLHVLYVVPTDAEAAIEKDDLNDDFVAFAGAGIEVRSLGAALFQAARAGEETYYYGGSPDAHHAFFLDYPWGRPTAPATLRPSNTGKSYTARTRKTSFSAGPSTTMKPRPSGFGTVPVMIALGTGVVLGARHSRSGSWNRSSGGWGGG